ncbi:DEAD/DEAH box helicase [Leucobacter sp. cx-87]|uniref:DEAD/DEAH box helicase n=1 Tax=Leucobacter sp. cx-87 TaxID=2770548 RepID=UPI00165E4598|nr:MULTISPECIES: DEAD/DEAH box helicase [unclassified Leucobacter]MBC9937075.1 DEAD/DEAH box helicase [Leucobacter sp. cx-87]
MRGATTRKVYVTNPTFAALGVPVPLVEALAAEGKIEAFPIQRDTLGDTLAGRDVLGRGRTGSGKTIAFAIPLVARLAGDASAKRRPGRPRGLVLAPTRELVTQIANVIEMLGEPVGIRTTTIFGGVSQKRQEDALARGVDIVVAAPGRLDDLMKQGIVDLGSVEITVLDEADHMADLGFLPVVTRIMDKTPQRGQRLLFSATLDNGVDRLVKKYLTNPIMHSVDSAESPVAQMTHHVFSVSGKDDKNEVIEALASGAGRRILFTRTKHQAKKLAKHLTARGIPAVDLHGNLSQNARDRNLAAFSDGSSKVLVATDVAARGVHVDGIELVVHVDPPAEHKAYLHRSGRTARAGAEGDVVTICLPEQRGELKQLLRAAKINVTPESVNAGSASVTSLVGEVADKVDPAVTERLRDEAFAAANGGRSAGQGQSTGKNAQRKRARGHVEGGRGEGQGRAGSGRSGSGRGGQGAGRGGQGAGSGRSGQGQGSGAGRSGQGAGSGSGRSAAPRGGASRGSSAGAGAPVVVQRRRRTV